MTYRERAGTTTRRIPGILVGGLLVASAAIAAVLGHELPASSTAAPPTDRLPREHHGALGKALPGTVWPAAGQAAVRIGESQTQAGPNQHAAPIASVAKVMTAYLVLRDHPLEVGEAGPAITLTDADVADTDRRRGQDESVVSIAAGEQLTELQALQALLLPSANNIAAVLARWDAGSVARFVVRMNATARSLGMSHTRYTDPSGYEDTTVSTAADQVRIVVSSMRLPVFARIVATPSATLPVAGTVHNTNRLLSQNGFVGVKTGSDKAAGSCFAFRAFRSIHGKRTAITGVVLGQPGYDLVDAGLVAAAAMVDRITGQRSTPGLQQPSPPPLAAPGRRRPRSRARAHPRARAQTQPKVSVLVRALLERRLAGGSELRSGSCRPSGRLRVSKVRVLDDESDWERVPPVAPVCVEGRPVGEAAYAVHAAGDNEHRQDREAQVERDDECERHAPSFPGGR